MIATGDNPMARFALTLSLALLTGSTPLVAQDAPDPAWPLTLIDGQSPGFSATLSLDQPGFVRGRGPCNGYSARLTGTLPAVALGAIRSTKMACPDLAAERAFFALLGGIDTIIATQTALTLSGNGHVMVFAPFSE